jgi:hypothetical protein
MGYTRPCKTLARAKPVGRVLSSPLMISLLLQLAVVILFQVSGLTAACDATPVGCIPDVYMPRYICSMQVRWCCYVRVFGHCAAAAMVLTAVADCRQQRGLRCLCCSRARNQCRADQAGFSIDLLAAATHTSTMLHVSSQSVSSSTQAAHPVCCAAVACPGLVAPCPMVHPYERHN